jgi:hypothetical protein
MPQYIALTYTQDVDWSHPDQAAEMAEYGAFGEAVGAIIRGGGVLYPTATATTVRVSAKGGEALATDGPYADTKEALTGFFILECADLDEAIAAAAQIPAAWNGAVEVRPLIELPGSDS